MATKFHVQAVDRSALGHAGSWRAGRFWPSASVTEIELVDEDKDPPAGANDPCVRVGRESFAKLKGDGNLRVVPAGDPVEVARAADELVKAKAHIQKIEAENAALKAEIVKLRAGKKAEQKSEPKAEEKPEPKAEEKPEQKKAE